MTTQPKIKLKYAVQLRKERVEGLEDTKPYIGLEHIESSTGRLTISTLDNGETPEEMVLGGESLCNLFEPGDVLFGKLRPYLAKTWVANFSGRCTTELLVMQPLQADASYLKYNFLANEFLEAVTAASYGSKMPRADWDFIGNREILNPPLPTQRRIAAYLDRETAHIDTLIAAKERLLLLMAEKRQALIARAVTRGLDETVKLKDSGVPWLGEVPSHWKVKSLKYSASLKSGDSLKSEDITPDGDYPVYGGNGLRGYYHDFNYEGHHVLIGRQGALCGNINYAKGKYWATEHAVVVTIIDDANTVYLGELLQTMNLNQYSVSAAQPGLSVEVISNLIIPCPPKEEQVEIANYIRKKTRNFDALLLATKRTIRLLKERRSALIAAAVTGQLNIPES